MIIRLLFEEPMLFLAWIVAIFVALSVHEFSHAWAGVSLGDITPRLAGRVTLNPLAHLDPLGFLMLLFVGFGWGKPVPFNPYNLRGGRLGPGLVAAAGPLANLVSLFFFGLVLKFLLLYNIFPPDNLLIQFLELLVIVNLVLLVFNLIPIPPLDGSKVLFSLLPDRFNNFKTILEMRGPLILLFLIILDSFLPFSFFTFLFSGIFNLVYKLF